MDYQLQQVENSPPEVGLQEREVADDALDLELGCDEEEADEAAWEVKYTMKMGEKSRKNLRVVRALIMSSTSPAMPKPMSSPLGGARGTRR